MAKYQIVVESMLESIMPIFLKSISDDLVKLQAAIAANDFAALQALGHKIKGSAGGYGFDQLGAMAKEMEFAAKDQKIEICQEQLNMMIDFMGNYEITYLDEE